MKILVGNKIYLQNYDVVLIIQKFPLEASLREEIFGDRGEPFIINGKDILKFGYSFQKPDNIEWLECQDWIVNYDEYSGKSIAELNDLLDQLNKEYRKKESDLLPRSRKNLEKHSENLLELSKLHNKIDSIEVIKRFATGELSLTFPENYGNKSETNNTKKKQCFFHRIFAHSLVFGRKSTTSSAH